MGLVTGLLSKLDSFGRKFSFPFERLDVFPHAEDSLSSTNDRLESIIAFGSFIFKSFARCAASSGFQDYPLHYIFKVFQG